MPLIRTPISLKVPARIAAIFWAIKLLTTAFGESTSDYLVHNVNPYLAVVGGFVLFVVAMTLQLRTDRYVPWIYWLAVAMVAVFGTMTADVVHIQFGVPYLVSSLLFAVLLVAVFWSWSRSSRRFRSTASRPPGESCSTGPRSRDLRHGYGARRPCRLHAEPRLPLGRDPLRRSVRPSGLALYAFRINAILAFWAAYVMTRPLGASFADWTGKSRSAGGLGWVTAP